MTSATNATRIAYDEFHVRSWTDEYQLSESARWLYSLVCNALDRADQERDEYCLSLSNLADELAGFIAMVDVLKEASS